MSKPKLSKKRQMIIDTMKAKKRHMTADEVHTELRESGETMGIATVYRNLNYLYEHGYLNRVQHHTLGYIYDVSLEKHYHFKCNVCGKVSDLDVKYQDFLNEMVKEEIGSDIVSHDIIFEGICNECKNS